MEEDEELTSELGKRARDACR